MTGPRIGPTIAPMAHTDIALAARSGGLMSSMGVHMGPLQPIETSQRYRNCSTGWTGRPSAMGFRVDLHLGAESGDHWARRLAVDRDAPGDALRHLDPIAGGVLRRKDRKFG